MASPPKFPESLRFTAMTSTMRVALFLACLASPSHVHSMLTKDSASIERTNTEVQLKLRPAIEVIGKPARHWALAERMAYWHVPGVSIAVIRNGKVAWAKGYGVRQAGSAAPINADTVFSVGSLSKVAT